MIYEAKTGGDGKKAGIHYFFEHPLTPVTISARFSEKNILICDTVYLGKKRFKGLAISHDKTIILYAEMIRDYLDGKNHTLNAIPVQLETYSKFQHAVLTAAQRIPWGTTVSYKKLAHMSGYPQAVRAAARVMRNNRYSLIIPCHRVIKSNGDIGGFGGRQKGKTVELKRKLLEREGVSINNLKLTIDN